MADGSHFLKINDTFCCRFNISVRMNHLLGTRSPSVFGGATSDIVHNGDYTPDSFHRATDSYNDHSTNQDISGGHCLNRTSFSEAYYLSANITWEEVRKITGSFQEGITLYCSVNNTVQINNLTETNASIISKAEYLAYTLGPRHISSAALAVLSVMYVLIFLTGVLGNLCTCVVITRNRCLHTATNYYLFSLAISDVLTLLVGKYMIVVWSVFVPCLSTWRSQLNVFIMLLQMYLRLLNNFFFYFSVV